MKIKSNILSIIAGLAVLATGVMPTQVMAQSWKTTFLKKAIYGATCLTALVAGTYERGSDMHTSTSDTSTEPSVRSSVDTMPEVSDLLEVYDSGDFTLDNSVSEIPAPLEPAPLLLPPVPSATTPLRPLPSMVAPVGPVPVSDMQSASGGVIPQEPKIDVQLPKAVADFGTNIAFYAGNIAKGMTSGVLKLPMGMWNYAWTNASPEERIQNVTAATVIALPIVCVAGYWIKSKISNWNSVRKARNALLESGRQESSRPCGGTNPPTPKSVAQVIEQAYDALPEGIQKQVLPIVWAAQKESRNRSTTVKTVLKAAKDAR